MLFFVFLDPVLSLAYLILHDVLGFHATDLVL
jgi:hypothetical protein